MEWYILARYCEACLQIQCDVDNNKVSDTRIIPHVLMFRLERYSVYRLSLILSNQKKPCVVTFYRTKISGPNLSLLQKTWVWAAVKSAHAMTPPKYHYDATMKPSHVTVSNMSKQLTCQFFNNWHMSILQKLTKQSCIQRYLGHFSISVVLIFNVNLHSTNVFYIQLCSLVLVLKNILAGKCWNFVDEFRNLSAKFFGTQLEKLYW